MSTTTIDWCVDCERYATGYCINNHETEKHSVERAVSNQHQPAARGGGDDVVFRAVAYLICDGIVNSDKYYPPEIATWARDLMVNEQRVGIQLIREAIEQHNQRQSLVAERERLRAAIEVAIHNLNAGNDPKFLADYLRLTLDQNRRSE